MKRLLFILTLLAAACGGEQSVASKSAAAYREAQAKGVPVGGGHDHGHTAAASTTGGGVIDHAAHGTATDAHAGMDHGTPARGTMTDHSAHGGTMSAAQHAAMGHTSAGPAMDHGAHAAASTSRAHAGMQHGSAAVASDPHAQHGQQPAAASQMDHSQHTAAAPRSPADPHAQHGTVAAGAPAPSIAIAAPRSSAEIQRIEPASTLKGDVFDAPNAVAVSEAAKAAQGGGHAGHETPGITPGAERENPPSLTPATRERVRSRPKPAATSAVYTCPMHPEVTSDKPGTCPKCGMALVKKK